MRLKKAVITAAGIGTRMLTATKEQPKEMLPLFSSCGGSLCVKPLLQMIFEQLYDYGFREFCFVVGRGKRVIEDHFTVDYGFVNRLLGSNRRSLALALEEFYRRLEDSVVFWVNQPEPRGFGHAVLMARPFVGDEPFLVHAGDTYIYSSGSDNHLERLRRTHWESGSEATLLLKEVDNPRLYGVAEVDEDRGGVYRVRMVVEKPEKPPTNLAIMPVYIFNPSIFEAIERTPPGLGGEIQLTDAIQRLIDSGHRVYAVKLREREVRLDVGTPETYWEAISISYKLAREPSG